MDACRLEKYVDRIYGWAVRHTFTYDEADELSQEIFLAALKSLPRLRDESRFEPWLWGIAKNTGRVFARRAAGNHIVSIDTLPDLPEPEPDNIEEEAARLRLMISRLSSIWRDIVVLHYFDDLSTKEISRKLGIPEGTVTWRLSEARKKLQKEYEKMEESALHPVKLRLDIYGGGNYGANVPFPDEYISDALSQNILWHSYETPRTVESLSKLCGVPAYYIEDSLRNLIRREAVTEVSKGKYQTDFPITTNRQSDWLYENTSKLISGFADPMYDALTKLSDEMKSVSHYRAGYNDEKLKYLYGVKAFYDLSADHCKLPYPEIPAAYDGFRWRYIGHAENSDRPVYRVGHQSNSNLGSRGHYSAEQFNFAGFVWKPLLFDYEINICEDLMTTGTTSDTEHLPSCVESGIVGRRGGKLVSEIPAMTAGEYRRFSELREKIFLTLVPGWNRAAERLCAGYESLFPRHLSNDAKRLSRYLWFSASGELFRIWQEDGRLKCPENGSFISLMTEKD